MSLIWHLINAEQQQDRAQTDNEFTFARFSRLRPIEVERLLFLVMASVPPFQQPLPWQYYMQPMPYIPPQCNQMQRKPSELSVTDLMRAAFQMGSGKTVRETADAFHVSKTYMGRLRQIAAGSPCPQPQFPNCHVTQIKKDFN